MTWFGINSTLSCCSILGDLLYFFKHKAWHRVNIQSRFATILVCLVVATKYHTLGAHRQKHLFLTVLELRKSNVMVLADPVSGEGLLPHGGGDLSGVSFIRVPIPLRRSLPSNPHRLPKAPSPNTNTWGLGFKHMNFWRTQTFRP